MAEKKSFNTDEAVQFMLDPDSDSNLSDLNDDEDQDITIKNIPARIRDEDEEISNEEQVAEKSYNEESEKEDEDEEEDGDNDNVVNTKTCQKFEPRWRKNKPPTLAYTYEAENFSLPPDDVDTWTPLSYFKMFSKHELNVLLAEQTNIYSVQKTGNSLNTAAEEIEQLIGIQMYMSIINFPNFRLYWANETRYPIVPDIMSRNRYQKLREFLHVSDNLEKEKPENVNNKLFKIQPVLDQVRNNCILTEPERDHSVDEQIIPAKTKYSGIRQYNPKKPKKFGFKNFVRAGSSGIMYDFFLYSGKMKNEKVTDPYTVEKLLETLPKMKNFKAFFDNWFATFPLCLALKKNRYLVTATLRKDRTKNCPLPIEKDPKKKGRGSQDYRTDANSGITITKWYDNKCVQLISSYCDPDSTIKVKRWDNTSKTYIDINCPTAVQEYNKSMGGVDLADMLIALYRTTIKSKRWYLIFIALT